MGRRLILGILILCLGTALWAAEPDRSQQWVLPILVGGTPSGSAFYGSNLHLMNLSTTTAELQVTVFAGGVDESESEEVAIDQPQPRIRLAPGQASLPELRLQEIGDERPGIRQGWALLEAPAGVPLHLAVELTDFREDENGSLKATSSVMVDAVRPARAFSAFVTWEGSFGCFPNRQSAYAFVNPSETKTAHVEVALDATHATGQERVFRRRLEIPPRGRTPIFLSELLPDLFPRRARSAPCIALFNQPASVLKIASDIPIAVGALDVDLRSGQFVNLPIATR